MRLKRSALASLPIIALTNAGTVKSNSKRDELNETNFTTGNTADGSRRDWRGLKSPRKRDGGDPFAEFQRPGAALRGDDRAAGLDLISQYGTIVVTVEP